MEIGSFIELQFPKGLEYYKGDCVARLNSGRAAIYHAFLSTGCKSIWLPYYQCESVRDFLLQKEVQIKYYNIDSDFRPQLEDIDENEAILIVNFYGIFSSKEIRKKSLKYHHVIIDNSQAFFAKPENEWLNVYSARKFIGVPDGAYVIGKSVKCIDEYPQGFSSNTAAFMLKRIEYGCEGEVYRERTINEKRIDTEDISKMSRLTHTILDGTNYQFIIDKRRENFYYACELFDCMNMLDVHKYEDSEIVPMVYPLMVKNDTLLKRLLEAKHFQGNWWKYILDIPEANRFEKELSRYMIPITIDQRYDIKDLNYLKDIIYG